VQEITRLVRDRAARADTVAVLDDGGEHRMREVLAEADAIADLLEAHCAVGPTVLLEVENTCRTVAAALAVGRLGGTLALVGHHAVASDLAAAMEDLRPDAVVLSPASAQRWEPTSLVPGARVVGSGLDGWHVVQAVTERPGRFGAGAVIGLTSGSTGRPKSVVQSEAALNYATACTIDAVGLRADEPVAAIVPLSSTAAFCFGVYLALALGGPLVLCGDWDPPKVLHRLRETGARWVMCVPTMALRLASLAGDDRPLSRMRALTVGGGPMDVASLTRAERALGVPMLRVFGMSECLGTTTPRLTDPPETRLGKDGRPFPGTLVRAVSAAGQELPAGEVGLAQLRGPSLFLGYARGGAVAPPPLTADGFLATGDLVRIGDDGLMEAMGRENDVIIRGGLNIGVVEIETAILKDERVAQVCVVPVADEVLGERIAALVVPAAGHDLDNAAVTAQLAALGLAKTRWPEFVFTVEEIPQTAVGKLARLEARRLAERLHAAGGTSPQVSA
jgi:non-ribosomal peptide synthetase component E (peptide arylation enzyme)